MSSLEGPISHSFIFGGLNNASESILTSDSMFEFETSQKRLETELN